ncbi:hypothetical protein KR222_008301 [Zaprionus bogoriensis]|nr:hypothetical protein KR222_008301 [Zaprionus bogoriensis]
MKLTRKLLALHLQLLLLFLVCSWHGTSARSTGVNLQSQYLRAISAYRRLERSLPPQELRALTGLGLLNGARQAEQQMEQHLVQSIKELLLQTDLQQGDQVLPKIDRIEQQLARDKRALNILSSAMDVLSSTKNEQQFRQELRELLQQQQLQRLELQMQLQSEPAEQSLELGERLGQLRLQILQQVPQMKNELETKIDRALEHIVKQAPADGPLARASLKVLHKREAGAQQPAEKQEVQREREKENLLSREPSEMRVIKSILTEVRKSRSKFVWSSLHGSPHPTELRAFRKFEPPVNCSINAPLKSQNVTAKPGMKTHAKQEDGDGFSELDDNADMDNGGGGGGGLVGIIGSLSGGEGGSDVGALIGALTGLISTLFGPGGLDIEALISTATSLLAGLLAGNKNFGTVLGQYVGTALDGLSGGGGAVSSGSLYGIKAESSLLLPRLQINNGQFLGNFLGTVLASLSADPEDEGPPQPLTFTKNFLSSFIESKFRQPGGDASEERHGSAEVPKKKEGGGGGFDSGGFVKQIASHLVSSALGLLLNASLGASGGASHASAGLFASSSHHMKPVAGHRSWEQL